MVSVAGLIVVLLCVGVQSQTEDVVSVSGSSVTLHCADIEGARGGDLTHTDCEWRKEGSEVSLPQSRLSVSDCDLSMNPVLLQDEGMYECGASKTRLTVHVEPGVPYIRQGREEGGVLEAGQGGRVELQCESQGGRPPAELVWRQDGLEVMDHERITEQVTRLNTGAWKTRSTYVFKADNSVSVTCEATSASFPKAKVSPALQVMVRFRPRVEIELSSDVIKEGDSFEVLCKSQAYPEAIGYRWFFSGAELEGITNNSILVEEITRMYNEADITCLVENEEGETEASTNLNVRYPPSILLHPRSQFAKLKDNVTFHCVAESNPDPSYIWTQNKTENLYRSGQQNLSLIASEETEAVYRCHVFAEGFKRVSSLPASLTLIRKPDLKAERERVGVIGQDVVLQCKTRDVSNRTRIVWLRSSNRKDTPEMEPVDLDMEKYKVVNTHKDWRLTSDLIIKKLDSDDITQYGCFAENSVGTDLVRIRLKKQTGTNALSVLAAVSCILGFVILLCIFIYFKIKKRCRNKDQEKW